jgi:sec-independent protein translocase protein TatC
MTNEPNTAMTFWDHLDEFRSELVRMAVAVVGMMCVAFLFKDELFSVVLAPKEDDFLLYRAFCRIGEWLSMPSLCPEPFGVKLINTQLAAQFTIHMSVAFYAGLLVAMPYVIYRILAYVSPALYAHERRHAVHALIGGYVLFLTGVVFDYLLIFPLTVRFLATYQVSAEVENCITLQSYVDTLTMMSLMMGILFELPLLCRLFAKMGWLTASFMRQYRRHAVVLILIVAAIITPTTDVFTLVMVAVPIYLLFEASILIVRWTERSRNKE